MSWMTELNLKHCLSLTPCLTTHSFQLNGNAALSTCANFCNQTFIFHTTGKLLEVSDNLWPRSVAVAYLWVGNWSMSVVVSCQVATAAIAALCHRGCPGSGAFLSVLQSVGFSGNQRELRARSEILTQTSLSWLSVLPHQEGVGFCSKMKSGKHSMELATKWNTAKSKRRMSELAVSKRLLGARLF